MSTAYSAGIKALRTHKEIKITSKSTRRTQLVCRACWSMLASVIVLSMLLGYATRIFKLKSHWSNLTSASLDVWEMWINALCKRRCKIYRDCGKYCLFREAYAAIKVSTALRFCQIHIAGSWVTGTSSLWQRNQSAELYHRWKLSVQASVTNSWESIARRRLVHSMRLVIPVSTSDHF